MSAAPLAPSRLAWAARGRPLSPRSLLGALEGLGHERDFAALVHRLWPEGETARAILTAEEPGWPREAARVVAFCERFGEDFFPIELCEEYEHVVGYGIPFARLGFTYDAVEEFDGRLGVLMALIGILGDSMPGFVAHCELLEEELGLDPAVFALAPHGQRDPGPLARALGEGPYVAMVDLATWLYRETGTAFLDSCGQLPSARFDAWTPEAVAALTADWARARPLLERVEVLADLLESDPHAHFPALLRLAASAPVEGGTDGEWRAVPDGEGGVDWEGIDDEDTEGGRDGDVEPGSGHDTEAAAGGDGAAAGAG